MTGFARFLTRWKWESPVTDFALAKSAAEISIKFPADYIEFQLLTSGGEGFVGNSFLILWKIEELVSLNSAYQVERYAPGVLLIGSSGGGEAYAFDTRRNPMPIVRLPFVGMTLELVKEVAPDFSRFLQALSNTGEAAEQKAYEIPKESGREIFEIKPVILGGEPIDPRNKILLSRKDHIEAVRYWNKLIADIRKQQGAPS